MADPTPQELQAAAQKQAMQEQAQFMARRMNLISQKIDVELQLDMMGMEPLTADVLTSCLASCAVRYNLRQSRIIGDFQEKMVRAARFAKAQAGDAAASGVIPDGVPPADKDSLRALGVRFSDDPPDLPHGVLTLVSDPSENKPEAPSDVAPDAAPAS